MVVKTYENGVVVKLKVDYKANVASNQYVRISSCFLWIVFVCLDLDFGLLSVAYFVDCVCVCVYVVFCFVGYIMLKLGLELYLFLSCRLYYAKIGIGTPSKDYYLQVDTGSDIMWVNCIQCRECPSRSSLGVCPLFFPLLKYHIFCFCFCF